MKKIALIVSTPTTFNAFYKNHVEYLKKHYHVTLISNFNDAECMIEGVERISLSLARTPSLINDLICLFRLIGIFKKYKFDLVHSTTPKAGLLTQLAGYFANIKKRVHIYTGQVWANKVGIKRYLLKFFDVLIAKCSTHLLADSLSQREFLIKENITNANKIQVLGHGSISGVNLSRFKEQTDSINVRRELNIDEDDFVFLFIGRLNKDKGILELLKAFDIVVQKYNKAVLVIVGQDEEQIVPIIKSSALYSKAIHYVGFTREPEKFMAMANVLCLPSYREGFGSVIIEAAACGTPSIGSNIYGLIDAIEDQKSGLLHKVGDVEDIADKMLSCINDKETLSVMSSYGKQRAQVYFSENYSSQLLLDFYDSLLKASSC